LTFFPFRRCARIGCSFDPPSHLQPYNPESKPPPFFLTLASPFPLRPLFQLPSPILIPRCVRWRGIPSLILLNNLPPLVSSTLAPTQRYVLIFSTSTNNPISPAPFSPLSPSCSSYPFKASDTTSVLLSLFLCWSPPHFPLFFYNRHSLSHPAFIYLLPPLCLKVESFPKSYQLDLI